jgi:hypothetical protein
MIAMVRGARTSVSQKRSVSVRPRPNVAIRGTERIKNQIYTGMRCSNAAMRRSWRSMVSVTELTYFAVMEVRSVRATSMWISSGCTIIAKVPGGASAFFNTHWRKTGVILESLF